MNHVRCTPDVGVSNNGFCIASLIKVEFMLLKLSRVSF